MKPLARSGHAASLPDFSRGPRPFVFRLRVLDAMMDDAPLDLEPPAAPLAGWRP